jgi:hypothetical protein
MRGRIRYIPLAGNLLVLELLAVQLVHSSLQVGSRLVLDKFVTATIIWSTKISVRSPRLEE